MGPPYPIPPPPISTKKERKLYGGFIAPEPPKGPEPARLPEIECQVVKKRKRKWWFR